MMRKLETMMLILTLALSMGSCSGTFNLRVEKTPHPAAGATPDAVATLDAALRATLAAPKATSTTSADVEATVRAAVAATVAAAGVSATLEPTAVPEPTAILPAPVAAPALLFSTYFGGGDSDEIRDLAVDGEGNIYIVGTTSSPDLPTTPGAYDASLNGGRDAFVAELSADGSTLLHCTYLGGGDEEYANAIAVDGEGYVYITGDTRSGDFPATPDALDTTHNGGQDVFVAKLTAALDQLIYSTYLGGNSDQAGQCIAVDPAGNAYVGGATYDGFPVTPGAAQTTCGGLIDVFVAKLSPDGGSLVYATYLGGGSYEGSPGIAIDREGSAYVATHTQSSDFPTTPGAYDRVCENCVSSLSGHGVAAKLSADGSEFLYSTLVGGADPHCGDGFYDIAIDPAGSAYLTGDSSCANYPTTPGALQSAFGGGERDAVVTKLNADGSDLLYSTYLGGAGIETGLGTVVDAAGNVTVVGFTDSADFPTAFPWQPANGGGRDTFLVVLDQDGSALIYGTYFGGSGDELFDNPGWVGFNLTARGVYLAGSTSSADLPTTAGAYDVSFNGGPYDGFVALLNPFGPEAPAGPVPAATAVPVPAATESTAPTFTRITSGAIVSDGGDSSGACWGDYDNDGHVDLFVTNWQGENNFLYHNSGDGTFAKVTTGAIVNDGGWSRGCTWGDYDNDGFLDLFVSNDGGGNFLYHNEDGTAFSRVLSGPIPGDDGNCYGTAWVDYDNDGWLDLFVARHTNADNLLYHNRGDGTFDKVTTGEIVNDGGHSVSASWGDYDSDGCVDLYVANIGEEPSFLYHNNCDGSFAKIATGPVATDAAFSSTSNSVDHDNDGDLDLFVGNWNQENFLYCNDGGGTFTRCKTSMIVTDGNVHDSSWGDYDKDGDMDLFVGGTSEAQGGPPATVRLYQNNGEGSFTKIVAGPIVEDTSASGGVWGDYDNDGDLDLFVAAGGNDRLYRNEGNDSHWLQLKLVGAAPERTQTGRGTNRSAIGARVAVTADIAGRTVRQMQEVSGQTGLMCQNGLELTFGLGDAPIVTTVTIRWPSGTEQTLVDVPVDQMVTIQEPR